MAPPVAEPVRLSTGTAWHSENDGVDVAQTAYKCDRCGSWVNDTALHLEWHMTIDPSGRTAPRHGREQPRRLLWDAKPDGRGS